MDGLDRDLIERFIAEERLPHFKALIERGNLASVECIAGTSSPVVWTTVATGTMPEEHGVTGFTVDDVPVNSTHRQCPAFWNIFAAEGITTATLGWLATWPAEDGSGVIVSDRPLQAHRPIAPSGAVDVKLYLDRQQPRRQVVRLFTDFPYEPGYASLPTTDPRYAVNLLLDRRLAYIFNRDELYSSIARDILSEGRNDVVAVYLQGADYVGHGFWKYFEPEPFLEDGWVIDEEETEALGEVIPRYYEHLDTLLGDLLEVANEGALVLLLSDHGFQADPTFRTAGHTNPEVAFLSGNHRKTAMLVLAGPQVEGGARPSRPITHLDVLPTILYALGLPLAREMQGRPLLSFFTDEFIKSRRLRFVDSLQGSFKPVARPRHGSDDERVLEELRSLGYIQ